MKGANNSYFGSVKEAVKTTVAGAKLTVKHLKDALTKERRDATTADDENYFAKKEGIVTLQYPKEQIPVPDNGRYKLHNEMDDCIVCDKCAKICPVNCIDIEPIKSAETIGETSDGTPKRLYAAKFDIDMAKCCFCGLCTTVCPTECLTMTKDYDFSTFDVTDMNFGFATLTEEEANEKKLAYEKVQEAKKAKTLEKTGGTIKKPVLKKVVKPVAKKIEEKGDASSEKPKPVFKPKLKTKPILKKKTEENSIKETAKSEDVLPTKAKPAFKPKMKVKPIIKKKTDEASNEETSKSTEGSEDALPSKPKPVFKPKMKVKPVVKKKPEEKAQEADDKPAPTYRPKMKAKIKPVIKKKNDQQDDSKQKDD